MWKIANMYVFHYAVIAYLNTSQNKKNINIFTSYNTINVFNYNRRKYSLLCFHRCNYYAYDKSYKLPQLLYTRNKKEKMCILV